MKFNSVLLTDLDELKKISKDWNVLAKHALEDNINYEPRPLLSLLSNIRYANWCVLTLWCEKQLVGFFPLQQVQTYRVPIQQYTTLFENHFMSCVPLVHIDYAKEVVRSYLDWLNTGHAKLFHINEIVQGSAYGDLLQKELADARLVVSHVQTSDRAAVTDTTQRFSAYLSTNFGTKTRNTLKRKQNKISALGDYEFKICTNEPALVEALLDDLIEVEAKSWKSSQGTAIALHPPLRSFMLETALYAASENRLLLALSYLDGKPLAAHYCLINGERLMCYKLGHDEAYEKYSPGQLLMLHILEYALDSGRVSCVDSCAAADAAMFNRSLRQRVQFSKYRIASRHISSSLFLKCLRALKKLRS